MPRARRLYLPILVTAAVFFAGGALLRAEDAQYVGASKCKICHMNEYKVWETTKHAKALAALSAEEQKKPECLGCHVTGYSKTAAEGADLAGVQCEACHGPGSEYKNMKIMSKKDYAADHDAAHAKTLAAGLILPDEAACKSCHNEKSPQFKGFEFASAKEKIKHWK
jgi:Cytochrome c554 and c-prime